MSQDSTRSEPGPPASETGSTEAAPSRPEPGAETRGARRKGFTQWKQLPATVGAIVGGAFFTAFFGLLSLPISWITPRGGIWFFLARLWARCVLFCGGVRTEGHSEAVLDPDTRYVFLVNHTSFFDIPALIATLPVNARFAARHGLFRIPVLGWAMRAGGFISIDRDNRRQAKDAFSQAGAELAAGTSILFFPEGTRCHDGRLGTLERGGFLLALRSGMPIVPVGIEGGFEILPRGTLVVDPGRMRLTYGTPLDTAEYGIRGRQRLMEDVRSEILRLSGQPPESPSGMPSEAPCPPVAEADPAPVSSDSG